MTSEEDEGLVLGIIGSIFFALDIILIFSLYLSTVPRRQFYNLLASMQENCGHVSLDDWGRTLSQGKTNMTDKEIFLVLYNRPYTEKKLHPPSRYLESTNRAIAVQKYIADSTAEIINKKASHAIKVAHEFYDQQKREEEESTITFEFPGNK
jgi:hypothetical protein